MTGRVLVAPANGLETHCVDRALKDAGLDSSITWDGPADAVVLLALPTSGMPTLPQAPLGAPSPPVIVLAPTLDDDAIRVARRYGAVGLVPWAMPTSSLVAAVEALLRGDTNVAALPLLSVDQDQALLTEREEEVVRLIASGRQNKEIAAQLDISYHTVRTHVQHAMAKLGLSHRHALASWAQQHLVEGRPAVRDTS